MKLGPYPITRGEISGAFADLGVLVPLEAALIAINGLNPTTTLLGVGVVYVLAGWYFRLPMPVQPLKAFSVVAIATAVEPRVIAAGAAMIGFTMGVLALSGGVALIHRLTPLPVVRGIQFGLGLVLLRNGLELIAARPFLLDGTQLTVDIAGQQAPLGLLVGALALLLMVLLLRWPVFPASVAVLAFGVTVGLLVASSFDRLEVALGPAAWKPEIPTPGDFLPALWLLVIPQLPLSLANAVISTADVARLYFGKQAERVTPKRLAVSYSLANLWAGLAGGLPMCHGAGGLTAHYRLGARTPAATWIVGGALIAVALLFGQSAMAVRNIVPTAALGALLLYVGWEHLLLGLQVPARRDLVYVFLAGAVSMAAGGNLAIGAFAGLVSYWGTRWRASSWVSLSRLRRRSRSSMSSQRTRS